MLSTEEIVLGGSSDIDRAAEFLYTAYVRTQNYAYVKLKFEVRAPTFNIVCVYARR